MAEFEAPVVSAPLVSEGRVYVGTVGGSVVALEGQRGIELWTTRLESPVARPLVQSGAFLIATEAAGRYVLLDVGRGEVKSIIRTPAKPTGAVVLGEEGLLGAAEDGTVFCVDRRDGVVRWSRATRERIEVEPVVLPTGRAAIVSRSGALQVFDVSDGRVLWSASLDECRRAPVVADLDGDGRPELVVALMSGKLVALHAEGSVSASLWSALGGDAYRTFSR
jgi:outer membrane protein assembly factor BamB